MSVTPFSDTEAFHAPCHFKAPCHRPSELNPIIMSGWVTPSTMEKKPDNDDIENPEKKLIKYVKYESSQSSPYVRVKLFDTEEESVIETCAILKRY